MESLLGLTITNDHVLPGRPVVAVAIFGFQDGKGMPGKPLPFLSSAGPVLHFGCTEHDPGLLSKVRGSHGHQESDDGTDVTS